MSSISERKWFTLFSLLLWAQLIFSAGLTAWRYKLIAADNWPVYPSDNSPQPDQFAAFIKTICSDETAIGYLSAEYNSFARLNYELYPLSVHNLSGLTDNDFRAAIAENEILCLVYDYASDRQQVNGRRYDFLESQYVVRLEPEE